MLYKKHFLLYFGHIVGCLFHLSQVVEGRGDTTASGRNPSEHFLHFDASSCHEGSPQAQGDPVRSAPPCVPPGPHGQSY